MGEHFLSRIFSVFLRELMPNKKAPAKFFEKFCRCCFFYNMGKLCCVKAAKDRAKQISFAQNNPFTLKPHYNMRPAKNQ